MELKTAREIAEQFLPDSGVLTDLLEGEIRQLTIKVWFDAVRATNAVSTHEDSCPNYPHDKY